MRDGQLLPNDLVTEILEWLPVKSLIRFKCVSKLLYDLITSPTPTFINNHHLKGRRRRMLLLRRKLPPPQEDEILSFHDVNSSELEAMQPDLSISFLKDLCPNRLGNLHLLGSCNGIICMINHTCVVLCNPALREFKLLPPIPLDCPPGYSEYIQCKGFGITDSGEFKVILHGDYVENTSLQSITFPVQLYTSSTNSWKKIDKLPVIIWPRTPGDHVFFNGACHWPAITRSCFYPKLILSFNLNTEVFRQLDMPDCISKCGDDLGRLIVLNERLAIVQHQSWKNYLMLDVVEIWVMEQYGVKESWKFQYQIWPNLYICPFLSWKNDEWLLLETDHGQLASLSFHTTEVKKFKIYGVPDSMRALIYEESLVSLK